MSQRKWHDLTAVTAVTAVAAGSWLVAGCSVSAHVSIGGTPTVPKHTVETEVATTLARQQSQPVPRVVCPAGLKAKVGAIMYCSLTARGSTVAYPVKLQVNSTSGGQAHFHIVVSTTPGHFTAPG
jgi:Domain of unknown function (DUF4333)